MKFYLIEVVTWGTVLFYGTEAHAEEWRRHKANWEQSIARKREVTPKEAVEWIDADPHRRIIGQLGRDVDLSVLAAPEATP